MRKVFLALSILRLLLIIFLLSFVNCSSPQAKSEELDEILKDFNVTTTEIKNLEQKVPNDSLRLAVLSKLSLDFLNKDSTLFRLVN